MSQRIFVVLFVGLFITQILSGCTWFSDDEEEKYGKGFDETDLSAPKVPSYSPHQEIDMPDVNESQLPPGFSYNLNWALGDVYARWGGFIRISCENTGENDIFVYRYGIEINWSFPSEWIYEEKNVLIPKDEEKELGLVYVEAPDVAGDYSYNIIISLLVKDNELLEKHGIESWYDNRTTHGKENILHVESLEDAEDIEIIHNTKSYYDKLKKRVDFENAEVQAQVSKLIAPYPGDYNIYQVLAIFDFIRDDLTYISDPAGRDYWAFCSDTLNRGGGDCEDFSILFSSMVGAIGGTTRAYLTETHAFPALYIGDESTKNEILDAIRLFYGTDPKFVVFEEENDHWLAADPAGSLYMGGLPADAEPALISEDPLHFGFNFEDTTEIHIIDIVG
ncbi:MAG: transglutaminase family protein [Thermoplasmata archaeon]|nr:MAG: transglutaminase family protein [Thermoplasmata archaeon]